jgi:hypothetical protein
MTIMENISNVTMAVLAKLDLDPTIRYGVKDEQRSDQAVGGKITIRHPDYPDFDAGVVWVGSAVLDARAAKRTAQPQEYYDNLLELKAEVGVGPRFMFKWLEQGSSMEVQYRQTKPDAKVRADSLADTVAKWAHVLVQVTPEHGVSTETIRKAKEAERIKLAEEKQRAEFKAQLEAAREEARANQLLAAQESLIREYGDFLYDSEGRYYSENDVQRLQRLTVQSGAGFQIKSTQRSTRNSTTADVRPWFTLNGEACKGFSVGEIRAMLDALKQYRTATPRTEWLPVVPTAAELEIEVSGNEDAGADEDADYTEAPMELSASMLLGVPLPETLD